MIKTKRQYVVVPFKSVGNLKFGMTQEDVEGIMGKPNETIDDKIMGEVRESRNDFILIYIRKKLVEVRFSDKLNLEEIEIVLGSINLFDCPNVVDTLLNYPNSKPSKKVKGYINFYGLGINLGGFGKTKLKDSREMRIFAKGRIKYFELYLTA